MRDLSLDLLIAQHGDAISAADMRGQHPHKTRFTKTRLNERGTSTVIPPLLPPPLLEGADTMQLYALDLAPSLSIQFALLERYLDE